MGMSPAAVDRETPATMLAAFAGFKQFNGIRDDGISDDEFLQVLAAEQAAGRA